MSSVDQAIETQLKNIQSKSGKNLDELAAIIRQSELTKHSEIRKMLMDTLGLTYGDANTLTHFVLKSDGTSTAKEGGQTIADVVNEIYSAKKAGLRPIHDQLMNALQGIGEFEIAPKKGYISLRRKKQFAMIGPSSNSQVEVGINIKNLPEDTRLLAQPAGSMCNYKVKVSDASQVDDQLIGWLRQAFNSAG